MLNIELSQQEVSQIIQILANRPYGEVYQLIAKIDNQIQVQTAKEKEPSL